MGNKEFKDTYTPYIERSYEDIKAGEVWMSDGHDLEMMCYQGDKKNQMVIDTSVLKANSLDRCKK